MNWGRPPKPRAPKLPIKPKSLFKGLHLPKSPTFAQMTGGAAIKKTLDKVTGTGRSEPRSERPHPLTAAETKWGHTVHDMTDEQRRAFFAKLERDGARHRDRRTGQNRNRPRRPASR